MHATQDAVARQSRGFYTAETAIDAGGNAMLSNHVLQKYRILPMLGLLVLAVGCQGLNNGKMEWVQTGSTSPRAGNVYLIRGLIGVFSTGMDNMSDQLNAAGVRAHVYQDMQTGPLAETIATQYAGVKNAEPLVLIGHSYGADDVLRVAHTLEDKGVTVDLVITVDATTPPSVPKNVKLCYNYYQSQVTDVIPMFRGIPLKQEPGSSGQLVNMNLRKDRQDLLESDTNHINIDKNQKVHRTILEQVLAVCPPRDVWVSRHGGKPAAPPAVSDAVQARHVLEGRDARPAGPAAPQPPSHDASRTQLLSGSN